MDPTLHDPQPDGEGLEGRPTPPPAWELIDVGRYQPRRTRGSFPGRELG